jgi:hypothetical protein
MFSNDTRTNTERRKGGIYKYLCFRSGACALICEEMCAVCNLSECLLFFIFLLQTNGLKSTGLKPNYYMTCAVDYIL